MGRHSADEFGALIRPQRRTERVTEHADYLAMMWRMARALEARAIDDPELLPQVVAYAQRMSEIVNVAIAVNSERYAIDPRRGASMAECGRALGISKQSASERRGRGQEVIDARVEAAGAVRFAEAARERDAIRAAADYAVTNLADWRARRAS